MTRSTVAAAFDAEAAALCAVTDGLTDADLDLASPCPPWTVGELLGHVLVATDRVRQALSEPDDAQGELVSAAAYYRPDERFSAAVNADRIETARALAQRIGGARKISAELARLTAEASELMQTAAPGRTVRTRHGDRMLLTDFAGTRVVELAVHGLDLAAGLHRQPWLTHQAGDLLEELMLPGEDGALLREQLGCDQAGLIARLTGRLELSVADAEVLRRHGDTRLALG